MNGLLTLLSQLGGADAPTDVEGVTAIMPKKKPAGPLAQTLLAPAVLDNSADIEGLNKAQANSPSIQRPKSTLRDVLGLLGDSFIMNEGGKPVYAPSIDARRTAEAGAGFTNNPAGAAERLMGLGLDGTPELANTIYNNSQSADLKRDNAAALAEFRQAGIAQKAAAEATKLMPYAGAILAGAKDKDDYALRWQQVQRMASKRGTSPEALGVPDPEDWSPELVRGFGLKANELAIDEDRDLKRGIDEDLGNKRIAATERGQDVSRANTRDRVGATIRGQDKASADRAAALTAKRDAVKNAPKDQKAAVAKLKPVPPADITWLKSNASPKNIAAFDKQFGAGAAKAYAGLK